ncbi:hypothetical protein C1M55_11995 [Rhodococcus qingshengii]|uniref:hypothetical protein n=1 Tax=Rhodococcus TaxID=1827 RepID=UPI000975F19E|nr:MULTISPECIES: hypothetical protein [Rhodococcus]AUS31693.1 hypothetical protein C1M55_11625 [Rhodococcus qingshengii]AUS31758.1 hypothetical protein C1M55_11995 [Rhodococcus qingshengii]MCC4304211.1 hypothetical protein [Rhodococcus sp. 3-2]OMQ36722.1 hypothetical protein BK799_09000 [Rhodococcus sp. D-1]
MTDTNLGAAAGDIFAKAFTLGYETGRNYIPAGGMALTAEQVEDVRKVLGKATTEYGAMELTAAWARLRALFPATEPAEDAVGDPLQAWKGFLKPKPIGWYRTMTRKFATEHFGFPEVTGLLECTHTASDGGTWGWGGDGDWELLVYPPAPAEPAEEKTKAKCLSRWDELRCGLDAGHAGSHEQGKCSDPDWAIWPGDHANPTTSAEHIEEEAMLAARGEGWYEGYEVGLEYGPIAASGEEYDGPINPYDVPASSPVVPAPTETGPWEDISEAPKHLTLIDRVGDKWTYDGDNWVTPETAILPVLYINRKYAPFVAAEEG